MTPEILNIILRFSEVITCNLFFAIHLQDVPVEIEPGHKFIFQSENTDQ